MNLRILKKLSKRAAPLLPLLGDNRKQFLAERDENYTTALVLARKHWERGRSVHADEYGEHEIKTPARDGNGWVYARPPVHPRKGTIMVGAISGYYEPEWDEETAWDSLRDIIYVEFTDWDEDGGTPLRSLRTPSEIFAAAHELITERRVSSAKVMR